MPLKQFEDIALEVGAKNGIDRVRTDHESNTALQNYNLMRLDDARTRAVEAGVSGPAAEELTATLRGIVRGFKVAYETAEAMLADMAANLPAAPAAAPAAPAPAAVKV